MEFWGVEVKSGESLKVVPGEGMVLHLSQAGLGEIKDKAKESVCLRVKVDGKNLVLGTLSPEKLPQQLFDLVFDRDFELSHNWKNGSVYFYGYKAQNPLGEDEDSEYGSDEDMLSLPADNGKPETIVAKQEKPPAAKKANEVKDTDAGKQKVKIVEPSKDAESEDDEEDSEESDEFDDSDEDDMSDDLDQSDEDSDEEDEETPNKVEASKKRPSDSAAKTPVEKKAKVVTPQKTDGKKGAVHVATPHPAKQAGKTPANKSNQKSPKSEGPHSCKTCNKTFKSDGALDSHNKAKHTAGK